MRYIISVMNKRKLIIYIIIYIYIYIHIYIYIYIHIYIYTYIYIYIYKYIYITTTTDRLATLLEAILKTLIIVGDAHDIQTNPECTCRIKFNRLFWQHIQYYTSNSGNITSDYFSLTH